jgi:hypothetical protein
MLLRVVNQMWNQMRAEQCLIIVFEATELFISIPEAMSRKRRINVIEDTQLDTKSG